MQILSGDENKNSVINKLSAEAVRLEKRSTAWKWVRHRQVAASPQACQPWLGDSPASFPLQSVTYGKFFDLS